MSYSATVLSYSPHCYLRLGETSGLTFADASGNGRNFTATATITAAAIPGAQSPCDGNGCLEVTSTRWADYVSAGWLDSILTGSYSINCWVYAYTTTIVKRICGQGTIFTANPALSTYRGTVLTISDYIYFYTDDPADAKAAKSTSTIPFNGWHMLTMSRDTGFSPARRRIYVDGVNVTDTATQSESGIGPIGNTGNFQVGNETYFVGYLPWQNYLDEWSLHPLLTDAQITALYTAGQCLPVARGRTVGAIS